MTDHTAPTDHDAVAEQDPVTHMRAHISLGDDDHAHVEAGLGPIDWPAWAAALLGAGSAALVLLCFWFALT